MSEALQNKIEATRARYSLVEAMSGACMAIAAFICVVLLAALLDWWLDFPWLVRAILLAGYVAGTAYIVVTYAILPSVRAPDDEEIALWVEREQPSLASRLIATVQFKKQPHLEAGISRSLVKAMMSQTEEMAEPLDFPKVVKIDRLRKLALAAGQALVVGTVAVTLMGQSPRDLVARVFLSTRPVPTKTQLECLTGSCTVARGDNLTISAKAHGWLISSGSVEIEYASGQTQIAPLNESKEDAAAYSAELQSVQESFSYRLRLFDGKTDYFKVNVTPRPAVVSLSCEIAYPAYTGLGTVARQPNNLSMLGGSKLRLKITANKPLRLVPESGGPANSATLLMLDRSTADQTVPLVVNPKNRQECTLDVAPPTRAAGFSLQLVDDDNITSNDPTIYHLEVTPDRPPAIQIVIPERKEVLLTRGSELGVGYVASDDYGIGKVTMHYKVNGGEDHTVLVPTEAGARSIQTDYTWSLAQVALPEGKTIQEGDVIEFWLEAEDMNTATGPGRMPTDHYQARIVSKAEKQKELIERMGEQLTGMKAITEREDDASKNLGEAITAQPATAPSR